jgi:putative DNA methylase
MPLAEDPNYSELHAAGWHTRGYLPHFDGEDLPQFVTIHLADSIPQKVLHRWEEELQDMKDKPRKVWLQKRINRYLDQGYGECFLKDPRVAAKVQNSLLHLEGTRYNLFAWVVMPNHVHTLLTRSQDDELESIFHSLKSFTAHKANKILKREGRFWFPECFDRYIRNEQHFRDTVRYIENNPVKAGLCAKASDWQFSSAWFRRSNC